MKPRKTGRTMKEISYEKWQSSRFKADQEKKMREQQTAEESRRKFEPDPQRIATQVMVEIPFSQDHYSRDKLDVEKYARVIAVECMRRMKAGSNL